MTKHTIHDGVIKAMHEYDKHSADMLMSNAFMTQIPINQKLLHASLTTPYTLTGLPYKIVV